MLSMICLSGGILVLAIFLYIKLQGNFSSLGFEPFVNTYSANSFPDYHISEEVLRTQTPTGTLVLSKGKFILLPWSDVSNNSTTYFPSGAYKYGSETYVPSYEDSIMLSSTRKN